MKILVTEVVMENETSISTYRSAWANHKKYAMDCVSYFIEYGWIYFAYFLFSVVSMHMNFLTNIQLFTIVSSGFLNIHHLTAETSVYLFL